MVEPVYEGPPSELDLVHDLQFPEDTGGMILDRLKGCSDEAESALATWCTRVPAFLEDR